MNTLQDYIRTGDIGLEEAGAIEDALDAAVSWQADELPLAEALQIGGGLSPHRARGLAFRFAWSDPRRPALEHLSGIMSAGFGQVLTTAGWMSNSAFEQSNRQVAAFRSRQPRREEAA